MYKLSRMFGGGESWYYLFNDLGQILDSTHERDHNKLLYLYNLTKFFNATKNFFETT